MGAPTSRHSRSNSSPIEDHPLTSQFDTQLCQLTSSESASLPAIQQRLSNLNELYSCIHYLLQLPFSQKAVAREQHEKLAEQALDGSLRLLDLCTSTTDVLAQLKECATRLQLALRRSSGELKVAKEAGLYLSCSRRIRKGAARCLKELKSGLDEEREVGSMAHVIGESTLATFRVLSCLLSCVAVGGSVQSRSNWSSLFKRGQCKKGEEGNEFEAVEEAVNSLLGGKTSPSISLTTVQLRWRLEKVGLDVEGIQREVGCLSRNLIKCRFTLLNILNH